MGQVNRTLKLFSGRSNRGLAKRIADECAMKLGKVEIKTFANGEIYARYLESVRGVDVFIIQSVSGRVNDNLMEMLIMADAAKRASARSVTAVLTHYGYSRQDKKSASREPITAKLVANLMTASGIDRTICIDLHQGQIQGFFDTPVNHLTALPIFADYFNAMKLANICVVSPDVGRAKAARKLAELLDADLAIMSKTRPEHNVSEVTTVIGNVKGKTCIINDDMIDTGGSVINGVDALLEAGARDVYVCATHGLFSGKAYDRIEQAKMVKVVVCDTVTVPKRHQGNKIEVISVAPLLAKAVNNVFNDESVSELFDPDFQI